MRRLSQQIAILLLCLAPSVRVAAQTYAAPGTFSGVGLSFIPDTYVAPKAEMRLDMSRLQLVRSSGRGSNNFVLGAGMSSNLEIYMRIIGEQVGSISSATSVAYGGKLLLPMRLPAVRDAALWFEAATSEAAEQSTMLAVPMTRVGLVATTGPNGSHALFLAGVAFNDQSTTALAGFGWVQPFSHAVVASPEAVYGYFGKNSYALILNTAVRVLPYVSIQVSPGYCRSNNFTSALVTLGLSISTAAIDFSTRQEEKQVREGFTLPTIEEMEKEGTQPEKPKGGSGGAAQEEKIDQTTSEIIYQGDDRQ
jgi:hypothetical protein